MNAFERVTERLRADGKTVRDNGREARTSCPACGSDNPTSLTIYRKPGRIKIVCYVGCNEELDILPALGLNWPDKYDEIPSGRSATRSQPDPAIQARIEARRSMTPVQRALDDLLQLPDFAERLCRSIAAHGGDGHE
jgi:hypothetical protein